MNTGSKQEVNTNYMQQDNRTVKKWTPAHRLLNTKQMGVNNENKTFTVRGLTALNSMHI